MRWAAIAARAALVALALLGLASAGAEPPAAAATPFLLQDAVGSLAAQPLAQEWLDESGSATLEQVATPAGLHRFQPAPPPDHIYDLGTKHALWLHLRLQRPRDSREEWLLEFPMPALDHVTVYQRDGAGWAAQTAGDTLPVSSWPQGGRYPSFRLDLPPGETREVLVRIQHVTPANFPVTLLTASTHERRMQFEYLAEGMACGALLLLLAGCLARGWVYRDPTFAWYAGYALVTSLAVASFTGVAGHLLWPGLVGLSDLPTAMLPAAAGGAGTLFVRSLFGLRRRFVRQDRLVLLLAGLGALMVLAPLLLPKRLESYLLGGYLMLTTSIVPFIALAAWRRGDVVGKWVCAAYVPMALAILATFLRIYGVLPVTAFSQYAVVAAMVVEMPLLLVALAIRSRDRHSAQVREQALSSHDALTGLLAPHLFQDRLRQVIARYKRDGSDAAVVFIDLVNHGRIKEAFGAAVAEQSLLRSVIKLHRLVRDVDTASRVGEARFAVILEGASSRMSVTDRAARLIAAGLMPLPGLKPDVTLQFHVAALLLNERPLEADAVAAALDGQLACMSPRTRRPIRFIMPDVPAGEAGQDSSLFAPDAAERRPRPSLAAV